MRLMRISAALLLMLFMCSGCGMKGYRFNLTSARGEHIVDQLRDVLVAKDYKRIPGNAQSNGIEHYQKDIPKQKPSWIHGKMYSVKVTVQETPFAVEIYNLFEGSDPEVREGLKREADSLEETIKKNFPMIIIERTEGETGIPTI